MTLQDLYSIKNCIGDKLRFICVGHTDLGRNTVFFDKSEGIYVKHYKNRTHYENELRALRFYQDCDLVPNIIHSFDMCICLSALKGNYVEETETSLNVYREMGGGLRTLHLWSKRKYDNHSISQYYDYEKNRLDKLFGQIDCQDQILYEMLLGILKSEVLAINPGLVLCHNDYCNRNVLMLDGRISGIIDFEKSHIADPMGDLATLFIKKNKSNELIGVLDNYFGRSISHNEKQRIIYYAIYKALEITTWAKSKDVTFYNKAVDFLNNWRVIYDIT